MKRKKTKLTVKLLSSFIGIALGLIIFIFLIGHLFKGYGNAILPIIMQISFACFCVLIVVLYSLVVNKILLKRIEKLNNAMKQTSSGNYEIVVEDNSNDEMSELIDSFNKMTAELKANAFLSKNFARYVSHEFKTPLSVIRSYAELSGTEKDKKALTKNIEIIISETDKLTKLSKNILTLCELDSTTIIKKEDKFIPATQIKNIIIALQNSWEEKNIQINLDTQEFEIENNENLIYLVWQNLIANAIKFSNSNGKIDIKLLKLDKTMTFTIIDNGVGIKEEDKKMIFQPFFMGDKSHNKEGNGLGLTLIKEIISKLNGTINFESEENKGTKFIVEIPIK